MILLDQNVIVQGGITEEIKRWETWWMTPFGLATDYNDAKARLEGMDMPIIGTIRPVPVAISKSMSEVFP